MKQNKKDVKRSNWIPSSSLISPLLILSPVIDAKQLASPCPTHSELVEPRVLSPTKPSTFE